MQVTHILFQDRQCGEVNLARGGQGSGNKLQPGKDQRSIRSPDMGRSTQGLRVKWTVSPILKRHQGGSASSSRSSITKDQEHRAELAVVPLRWIYLLSLYYQLCGLPSSAFSFIVVHVSVFWFSFCFEDSLCYTVSFLYKLLIYRFFIITAQIKTRYSMKTNRYSQETIRC